MKGITTSVVDGFISGRDGSHIAQCKCIVYGNNALVMYQESSDPTGTCCKSVGLKKPVFAM